MMQRRTVLFIDDEWGTPENSNIRGKFGALLSDTNLNVSFQYSTAADPNKDHSIEASLAAVAGVPDLCGVVLDVMFGQGGKRLGIDMLGAIRKHWPRLPVVMMTSIDSDADLEPLEEAMNAGATDYVCKNWPAKVACGVLAAHISPGRTTVRPVIWGNSPAVREVRRRIVRAAYSGANILITGESGVGKELVARAIHNLGPRRSGPFVADNVGAKESSLIESDLFGHVKGAFTGAISDRRGLFEAAHGGVLFLDEISAMPLDLQVRLLRVLETRSFSRVGETKETAADFQLVCASNEPLHKLVGEGRFRRDILFRIEEVEIAIPPLRQRRDDIALLADIFLGEFRDSAEIKGDDWALSPDALRKLEAYSWPGNVRELRNVLRRACIFCKGSLITEDDVTWPQIPPSAPAMAQGLSSGAREKLAELPDDPAEWSRYRSRVMLEMFLEARRRCRSNADFINRMYPNARNDDLRRALNYLFKAPYGACATEQDGALGVLRRELESFL